MASIYVITPTCNNTFGVNNKTITKQFIQTYIVDIAMAGRKPDVSDQEIITMLADANDPVLTTSEMSEKLPIKQNATQKRLKTLYEERKISGKKAGQGWVWWLEEK